MAGLFNSFCKEVYAVAFFKVVQQQTIGKVANSIMYLWADNFCLQQWKNYYNRTVFAKVMLKWKRVQFFDSQLYEVKEIAKVVYILELRGGGTFPSAPLLVTPMYKHSFLDNFD